MMGQHTFKLCPSICFFLFLSFKNKFLVDPVFAIVVKMDGSWICVASPCGVCVLDVLYRGFMATSTGAWELSKGPGQACADHPLVQWALPFPFQAFRELQFFSIPLGIKITH